MTHDSIGIFGTHAVEEALWHAPAIIEELYTAHPIEDARVRQAVAKHTIRVSDITKGLALVPQGAVHQGMIAKVAVAKLMTPYKEAIEKIPVTSDTLLIIADELQDPHNLGSIIRSAAAFGAAAVLIPAHHQVPITGTVVKVSAGMAFKVPLIAIGNVNQTIRDLKERGFWIYGLAGEGAISLYEEKFDAASVLVIGNEGDGIRSLTRTHCDVLLSIPMHPRCESLNAAVSAAVALSAWSRHHPQTHQKVD